MRRPIFVRSISDAERESLEAGLRSPDAFVLRRCQILLPSSRARTPTRSPAASAATPRERPQRHPSLQRECSSGGVEQGLLQAAYHPRGLRLRGRRATQGAASSEPSALRQGQQPVDLADGCGGELRGGNNRRAGHAGETIRATLVRLGVRWERAKRWITSPDPEYQRKKAARPADPCSRATCGVGGGFLGRDLVEAAGAAGPQQLERRRRTPASGGAVGRQRRSRPQGHLLLWVVFAEFEEVWLRFVDGRPVSGITTRFLSWCCEKLEAAGKGVWVLIWDNASWHVSHQVRRWIDEHNRAVKRRGEGLRIISCLLPKKSPWLNPIEPKWVHGKEICSEVVDRRFRKARGVPSPEGNRKCRRCSVGGKEHRCSAYTTMAKPAKNSPSTSTRSRVS